MEIKFKKHRPQPLTERITTPLSPDLKNRIENAERSFGFDPHETIRETLEASCKKLESGEIQRPD